VLQNVCCHMEKKIFTCPHGGYNVCCHWFNQYFTLLMADCISELLFPICHSLKNWVYPQHQLRCDQTPWKYWGIESNRWKTYQIGNYYHNINTWSWNERTSVTTPSFHSKARTPSNRTLIVKVTALQYYQQILT
jgi:hypothetical protein